MCFMKRPRTNNKVLIASTDEQKQIAMMYRKNKVRTLPLEKAIVEIYLCDHDITGR